jgi:sporulation protein YtfJ
MEKPIVDMMSVTLQKIKEMIDVNTIIGQAITAPDGTTIIPVSKLSFGFASGGSDFDGKNASTGDQKFGGGSGAGINIIPVAFLVVTNGSVKLLPVSPPAGNTVDRVVEMVPGVVDKLTELFGKDKKNQNPDQHSAKHSEQRSEQRPEHHSEQRQEQRSEQRQEQRSEQRQEQRSEKSKPEDSVF